MTIDTQNPPAGLEVLSHGHVRAIVSREHVGASVLQVCRAARHALKDWRGMPPTHRRYVVAAAIQAHAYNQWEYRYVMGTVPRPYPEFRPRYFFRRETSETVIVS